MSFEHLPAAALGGADAAQVAAPKEVYVSCDDFQAVLLHHV